MIDKIRYLLSYLSPKLIEKIDSQINGEIIVEMVNGQYRVCVDRYWQSGVYPQKIMKIGLTDSQRYSLKVKRILILGFGAGSMVQILNNHFPHAQITGVDLDPEMIKIGNKYFGLADVENLKIIISDAYQYVYKILKKKNFDLIVSDLFIGCETPIFVYRNEFLKMIYQILTPKGIFICNCSYNKEHKMQTDNLVRQIYLIFPNVEKLIKFPNLIIRAKKTLLFSA